MRRIQAETEGTFTLGGLDRDVVIAFQYDPCDFSVIVTDCWTAKGKKSALLKKQVEEELPFFLEEAARKDYDRRCETERDQAIDRRVA